MDSTTEYEPSSRLRKWQRVTVGSLIIGYAGYYVCRSNFSVVTPLLLDEFGAQGIDKEMIGLIASVGVFFYAVGKIFNGVLCDFVGGRKMFLFGMMGSVAATLFFGIGTGLAVFLIAWSLNRLIQSMGWGALVKITSNWFPFGRYGTIMGLLSLSFLFGDVVTRFFLGGLINAGIGWRGVFYAAAASLTVIATISHTLLKSSPKDIGEPEPPVNPHNLYGERGSSKRPSNLKTLLMPFFKSFGFWMVAIMSLGLTLIRESFNFWTPTYLVEVGMLPAGEAAQYSLLFPPVRRGVGPRFRLSRRPPRRRQAERGDLDRGGPAGVGARLYGRGPERGQRRLAAGAGVGGGFSNDGALLLPRWSDLARSRGQTRQFDGRRLDRQCRLFRGDPLRLWHRRARPTPGLVCGLYRPGGGGADHPRRSRLLLALSRRRASSK